MDINKLVEEIRKRYQGRTVKNGDTTYNETNTDYGTKTSGNWGHAGRPGEVGGSAPGGGHQWLIENRDTFRTKDGNDHATRWLKTSKQIRVKSPSETRKYLAEWQDKNPDIDLKKEGEQYKKVLSTVRDFEKNAPDKKDGTFSMEPPHKPQNLKRGFSLTFHQNNTADDPFGAYDDDTYGQMCAMTMHDLTGLGYETKGPFVGHYGNPEVSFVADDVDDALDFAVRHNQASVWDNKAQIEMINPFYKPEFNPIKGHGGK